MCFQRFGRIIACALALVLVSMTALTGSAAADSLDPQRRDAEARAAQAAQAAAAIALTIDGLTAHLAQAGLDLQATQARLPIAQAELAAAEQAVERSRREAIRVAARLADAQQVQTNLTTAIADDDARTAQARTTIGQLARRVYRGETAPTGLAVVMGATSARELLNQYVLYSTALRMQTSALDTALQVAATNRDDHARLVAVTARITRLKSDAHAQVARADSARAPHGTRCRSGCFRNDRPGIGEQRPRLDRGGDPPERLRNLSARSTPPQEPALRRCPHSHGRAPSGRRLRAPIY
ncbi:MAG: coiled-coil domain-containing protein [Cellulomonas sp.]